LNTRAARTALLVTFFVASWVFWQSPVFLPFKVLAVMGHETGHAVASLMVGGTVDRVSLSLDEGGECLSRTPDGFWARSIVFSAGYVGSALISVLLLVLSFRFHVPRTMLALASGWLLTMGLLYARDPFTLFFSLSMAALFAAFARYLPEGLVSGLNLFIATFTALYAVVDLKDDLWNSGARSHSDAQLLANLTIVPAVVWAAVWTALGLGVLGSGAWVALQGDVKVASKGSKAGRSTET
jgi:Peptidase M50B-like